MLGQHMQWFSTSLYTHIGNTIYMVHVPTCNWCFLVNVGKYTVPALAFAAVFY